MRGCPNNTYEQETTREGKTVSECKPCPKDACPRFCEIKDGEYLTRKNVRDIQGCEILNGNLIIIEALGQVSSDLLDMDELERSLSTLRIITGFVQIQSHRFKNLNFLRSLETIRARSLL